MCDGEWLPQWLGLIARHGEHAGLKCICMMSCANQSRQWPVKNQAHYLINGNQLQ
jgi:hypothetical protein